MIGHQTEYGLMVTIDELPISGDVGHYTAITWCHIDDKWEICTDGTYCICGECGHVFESATDLEQAYLRDYADTQPIPAKDIDFCPECLHDF